MRKRCLEELVKLLREAEVPSYQAAQCCMDPQRALEATAGTTRPSTLKSYLRTWQRWRRWCLRVYQCPWPREIQHVLDYLHERVDEPCGPSIPDALLRTLAWMEKAAGLRGAAALSESATVRRAVGAAAALVEGAKPTGPRRAPQLPVAVVAALEVFVCEPERPAYLRGVGWLRLLKVWGGRSVTATSRGWRLPTWSSRPTASSPS